MEKLPVTNTLRRTYLIIAGLFLLSCLIYFFVSTSINKSETKIHAKIFGRKISSNEFSKAYESQRIQFASQFGELYESFKPMIDIEQETLNTLILLEEAKHRNLKVTNQEVIDYISQFTTFFRNNKFDTNLYRNFLREKFHTNPEIFEENIRNTLLMKKLFNEVTSSVSIDESSFLKTYSNKQNKVQLSYVSIPFKDLQDQVAITISDEELQKFYKDTSVDFFLPPSIQLEYIKLAFPKDGGVQKEVEMKFKANAIVEEYKKGAEFINLGKKYKFQAVQTSLFSKDNPPDIGLSREMVSEAFKLPKLAVSSAIELPDGYLVYRVIDKKSSHQGTFEEVKETVKKLLIDQKLKSSTYEHAKLLQEKISHALKNPSGNVNFVTVVEGLGLKNEHTLVETLDSLSFSLNIDKSHLEQFLNLNLENPLSPPLLSQDAYLIIHVDSLEKSGQTLDEKKKSDILQNELESEKENAWQEFTEELLKEAHLEIIYP